MARDPDRHPGQITVIADGGAGGDQVVVDAGEQFGQLVGAATPQHVEVAALRDTSSLIGRVGQLVPFNHSHGAVEVAEHPGGE
jgi:hypothetical protein